ncbi:MAG TPA: flavodoxin family protein [Bacillota bacterium]|nr:flavodoxin family protein [Bacillota bacterium]
MKKITILNGNPKEEDFGFDEYCEKFQTYLGKMGNQVNLIKLRDKKIGDCIGCYSCWLKTPGRCAFKDDYPIILKAYVNSDLIIMASPMIMGFVSSELKKATDRLLPLLHPFLRVNEDRMAHYPRYDKAAKTGLILEKDSTYEESDLKLINATYRTAAFIRFTDDDMEVVAHEAHNL